VLNELNDIQDGSDESVQGVDIDVSVETREESTDEIVERVYTFGYCDEWSKWMLEEFLERRSPDTDLVTDRDWRQAQHIFWYEADATPEIEVPSIVADRLAMATGSESVTIQTPCGTIVERGGE
jgi:hypothetical protein